MGDDEQFAAWIAGAVLRSGGEDIQAEVLNVLVDRADASASLEVKLAEARRAGRRAGDFGAEIVGSLLIPVLIEAGKQLWGAFVKRLGEKASGELADVTLDEAKKLARRMWTGDKTLVGIDEFEVLIRQAANKEKLTPEQTDALIQAVRSERMAVELQEA